MKKFLLDFLLCIGILLLIYGSITVLQNLESFFNK